MGTICARTGCDVEASARATIAYSRAFLRANIHRPRAVSRFRIAIVLLKHTRLPVGLPEELFAKFLNTEERVCNVLNLTLSGIHSRTINHLEIEMTVKRAKLTIILKADDTTVAEAEDAALWQQVLAAIHGGNGEIPEQPQSPLRSGLG